MDYDYVKQGDCLELMKEIPDGSVELVCTDIPYGVCNEVAKRRIEEARA